MSNRNEGRPLFWAILMPQFLVLILIMIVLTVSMPASGMGDHIVLNYQKVVALQTANQGTYLKNYMTDNRLELSGFTKELSRTNQEKLDAGEITLDDLTGNRQKYASLLKDIGDDLLAMLYAHHAGGALRC